MKTSDGSAVRIETHRSVAASLNDRDLDAFLACYTDDLEYRDFGSGEVCRGKAELRSFAEAWLASVPDFSVELHSGHALDRVSTAEWTMSGTVTGELPGLPEARVQGKRFQVRGTCIFEFAEDGRIRAERDYWNAADMLVQLGVLSADSNREGTRRGAPSWP
jgi:steroid delta-isomerase-like uncharacterized protein